MLYFPRTDDTKDLKLLIKKNIFEYMYKNGPLREGKCWKYSTNPADTEFAESYDLHMYIEFFYFNDDGIFNNDNKEQISLADLLVGKLIDAKYFDGDVQYILDKRNLTAKPVKAGRNIKSDDDVTEEYSIDAYAIIPSE